jgi:hypothetical protein
MVETVMPRAISAGIRLMTRVVLPLQVVVAGDECEQRGDPEADLADQLNRQEGRAGLADDQHAQGDHLDHRLPLGQLADRHGHADLGQVLAQARDQDLAAQDDQARQDDQAADGVDADQHEDDGGDQQLVGDRVEEAAERRNLVQVARQVAVEIVGHPRHDEEAASRPARHGGLQIEQGHQQRDDHDAQQCQQIGQTGQHCFPRAIQGLFGAQGLNRLDR